jgi:hypothetical protein
MTDPGNAKIDLDAVLVEAVRGLTVLDAEAIEALAEFLEGNCERLGVARSPAEWARLRSRHWMLGHLLDGTGKRLGMLRRVSAPERFGRYGRASRDVSI